MKFTDELKICGDKIKANQVQYDLDREAAKTSALSSKDLDKYEYLTGEELALKPQPIEIKQAEYSPLAQIITKGIKKDDKVNKTTKYDDLMYISVFNFNKYNVSYFDNITSVDSEFDVLKGFHKEFIKLKGVKSKYDNTKQKKITILNHALLLYDELISIYKKEYNQIFKGTDKELRVKHDYKNLKDSDYQPDELQPDGLQPDQLVLPALVKVTKNRFNEIQSIITEAKKNKLKISGDGKEFTLDNAESSLKGITSGKIDGSEFKRKYNNIIDVETRLG